MRRPLFVVPAPPVAEFARGSARRALREVVWARSAGLSQAAIDRVSEALLDVLDRPKTRAEVACDLSASLGLRERSGRGGGWGSPRKVPCLAVGGLTIPVGYLLHLAGARGVICSGPNRGAEATFVRADAWLPGWRDLPPAEAEEALLRRYLRAIGRGGGLRPLDGPEARRRPLDLGPSRAGARPGHGRRLEGERPARRPRRACERSGEPLFRPPAAVLRRLPPRAPGPRPLGPTRGPSSRLPAPGAGRPGRPRRGPGLWRPGALAGTRPAPRHRPALEPLPPPVGAAVAFESRGLGKFVG